MSTRTKAALTVAKEAYAGKKHWAGGSLLQHVLDVEEALRTFDPDEDLIVAALLHHLNDDPRWTHARIGKEFGTGVQRIIHGELLLSKVTTDNRRMSMEHLRQILLKVSDDVRVVLFVLCHQLALLRHLDRMDEESRKRISRDSLRLYAPVAARLGIYTLKHAFETRAFPVVYPVDSVRIAEQLSQLHEDNGEFLRSAGRTLERLLRKEGVACTVEAREKQPFSIFRKMHMKSMSNVRDLYDLCALRVVVEQDAQCYQVLGLLHRIGHPVPNRFKDYIAFPKPNGYRSLHTTLAQFPGVPEGLCIEVQIRTQDMHREADFGLASHWSYKQRQKPAADSRIARLREALSAPGTMQQEHAETTSGADQIFVVTPKGDIVELPDGSTPLDFAFHVHTQVGLSFRSARVNGSIVPLTHVLENGDIVEITRNGEPRPSPRWLQLLKTASAKSRLKRFLASQERPTYLLLGREMLNQELIRRHLPPLDTALTILRGTSKTVLTFVQREDLLVEIGAGHVSALAALQRVGLLPEETTRRRAPASITNQSDVTLESSVPMPYCYAKCCKPEKTPRTEIIGVIGRGGEVRIHRQSCKFLRAVNRERLIGAGWEATKKATTKVR